MSFSIWSILSCVYETKEWELIVDAPISSGICGAYTAAGFLLRLICLEEL